MSLTLDKTHELRPAVIGHDGRTEAIIRCLERSPLVSGRVDLLARWKGSPPEEMLDDVLRNAEAIRPDFVVVGPEEPLKYGVVDRLEDELGIPSVGPKRSLAKIEWSKSFARGVLTESGIPGNPRYRVFDASSSIEEIAGYLRTLQEFVIKPDGLTGGKGVKVSGDHLVSVQDGVEYCRELLRETPDPVVVEEKLDGEEFSLQSFCDGSHVSHCMPVQDHKRAFDGDRGPNTGGMGSYTGPDHLLPFLDAHALAEARDINERVARAIGYRGVLFGGFMLTKDGVRLLEYNARFGDPECLNVLALLETDFAEICLGIINGRLDDVPLRFKPCATVCKYIVPEEYPDRPKGNRTIDPSSVPQESDDLKVFRAALEEKDGSLYLTGSRTLAIVGIGTDIAEAYRHAETAAAQVSGPVRYRRDIGSRQLIQQRVDHIARLHRQMTV